MSGTCENCGQPILDTDTVCWHCGWQLPRRKAPKSAARNAAAVAKQQPYPLSAVLVYGALTAAVIVATLLVMRSLGQRPLIIIHPETRLSAEWQPVTDENERFTLDLPSWWTWLDREQDQERFDALVAQNGRFQAALSPLGALADDTELHLIAYEPAPEGESPPAFLVVAQSARLQQSSPEGAISLARQNAADLEILGTHLAQGLTGQAQSYLLLEIPGPWGVLRCQQQFTPAQQVGFLVAACAPGNRFPRYNSDLQNILASFQPLSR